MIDELDRVRGIGLWTAELTMIRGMHRFGVLPADDLGVEEQSHIITARTNDLWPGCAPDCQAMGTVEGACSVLSYGC